MTTEMTKAEPRALSLAEHMSTEEASKIEAVLMTGNLAPLTAQQRVLYHNAVCRSLGLNPMTKPFDYLNLNGKTVLYAAKACTDQLRSIYGTSITIVSREVAEGCYVVTARATTPNGRTDESVGAVPIDGLKGEMRSNAMMKAETKAKRRATLSIHGLGYLDESEIDSIPGAVPESRSAFQQGAPREQAPPPKAIDVAKVDAPPAAKKVATWPVLTQERRDSDPDAAKLHQDLVSGGLKANELGKRDVFVKTLEECSKFLGMAPGEFDGAVEKYAEFIDLAKARFNDRIEGREPKQLISAAEAEAREVY